MNEWAPLWVWTSSWVTWHWSSQPWRRGWKPPLSHVIHAAMADDGDTFRFLGNTISRDLVRLGELSLLQGLLTQFCTALMVWSGWATKQDRQSERDILQRQTLVWCPPGPPLVHRKQHAHVNVANYDCTHIILIGMCAYARICEGAWHFLKRQGWTSATSQMTRIQNGGRGYGEWKRNCFPPFTLIILYSAVVTE